MVSFSVHLEFFLEMTKNSNLLWSTRIILFWRKEYFVSSRSYLIIKLDFELSSNVQEKPTEHSGCLCLNLHKN